MPDIPAQDPVATTAPDEPEPAKNERDLTQVTGGLLAGLASQVAILTAILVYFGWVRARATYGYFGVDVSTLDSGGNYFPLPEGWRQGRGSVVVLSATAPDIRVEFMAAPPG